MGFVLRHTIGLFGLLPARQERSGFGGQKRLKKLIPRYFGSALPGILDLSAPASGDHSGRHCSTRIALDYASPACRVSNKKSGVSRRKKSAAAHLMEPQYRCSPARFRGGDGRPSTSPSSASAGIHVLRSSLPVSPTRGDFEACTVARLSPHRGRSRQPRRSYAGAAVSPSNAAARPPSTAGARAARGAG